MANVLSLLLHSIQTELFNFVKFNIAKCGVGKELSSFIPKLWKAHFSFLNIDCIQIDRLLVFLLSFIEHYLDSDFPTDFQCIG